METVFSTFFVLTTTFLLLEPLCSSSDVVIAGPDNKAGSTAAERRLRDRWNAFVAERNRPLAFDNSSTSADQIDVIRGKDIFLTCAFNRPLTGPLKISFVRLSDLNLIAVGNRLHLPDARVSIFASEGEKSWTLRIKNAKIDDSDRYECQVNTQPNPLRRHFGVSVLRARVKMEPSESVTYVNVGSDLTLTCVIDSGPVKPTFITWYRDDQIVEYSADIDAEVKTSFSRGHHRSELRVEKVKGSDSGRYRCDSDLTGEAAVDVFVVKEDSESLSHDGGLEFKGDGAKIETLSTASLAPSMPLLGRNSSILICCLSLLLLFIICQ